MNSKYIALTQYLKEYSGDICKLTFDEIEEKLGIKLPNVVYKYSSVFWSNGNQHYALHWLLSGRIVSQYDMQKRFVVFVRNKEKAQYILNKCSKKRQTAKRFMSPDMHTQWVAQSNITCDQLIQAGEKYLNDLSADKNARYLSWEHCYSFFQNNRHDCSMEKLDHMCPHLAWYLASWGMLRGGSFLLQKDYLVHMPTVKLLTSNEYAELYESDVKDMTNYDISDKIIKLANKITEVYHVATITQELSNGKFATDTLVTKILLGTIGCVPAYDRYFKKGLSLSGIAEQKFNERSLYALAKYYVVNEDAFEVLRRKASNDNVKYTPMKVIDMCFWQLGYNEEIAVKAQRKIND